MGSLPDRQQASGVVEFEFRSPAGYPLPWAWRPHTIEVDDSTSEALLDGR
jgi:hypothetical protein